MYRYRVRPGYGRKDLLIEFIADSSDENFMRALKNVFHENNINCTEVEDLVFHYDYVMESPDGPFILSPDEWGMVWVHAEKNQQVIHFLDRILSISGKFEREEVEFSEYK